jgi:hypothetical protein
MEVVGGQRRLRSVMHTTAVKVCISNGVQGRLSPVIRIPLRIPMLGMTVNPRLESAA